MRHPRYEDYDIEYKEENRFAFLGNGFEMREYDGRDITNYLGCLDDEGRDVQPEYGDDLLKILAGTVLDDEQYVSAQKGNLHLDSDGDSGVEMESGREAEAVGA